MFKKEPKVSAVMCTYKRFLCVERAMNCFLAQDYPNKELIIFNTDVDNPYIQTDKLSMLNIKIINNNIDFITNESYTNVGAIRRDALTYATGDYVVTWDDDDIFLPFFMRQAIDRMRETGLPSFKPKASFFNSGNYLRLVMNTLEASVVADINKVREYGFLLETGKEGLGWYTKMRNRRELVENDEYYIPSYCFNWNDGQVMKAPHKQSGDIDNPNNFNNHNEASIDPCLGELSIYDKQKINAVYHPYYVYLYEKENELEPELVAKYLYEDAQTM